MTRFIQRVAVLSAAVALTATGLGWLASPASAYPGHDGKDPIRAGCAGDARTVRAGAIRTHRTRKEVGLIELRYSPRCRSAWARITNYYRYVPGDAHQGHGTVHRNRDGREYTCSPPAGRRKSCYTRMVNDAGLTAYAKGEIDTYPTDGYQGASGRTGSY
jgi:hypothetical protein